MIGFLDGEGVRGALAAQNGRSQRESAPRRCSALRSSVTSSASCAADSGKTNRGRKTCSRGQRIFRSRKTHSSKTGRNSRPPTPAAARSSTLDVQGREAPTRGGRQPEREFPSP